MSWQSIESAPKDGTVIWLRNQCMDKPVRGHWGEATWFGICPAIAWVSDFTSFDEFTWFPAGRLVVPDEWKPVESET